MNDHRFDRFTKALASGATRRRVLTGVLAVPLTLGWSHRSEAKEKDKFNKQCKLPLGGDSGSICRNLTTGAAYCGVCSVEDTENGFGQSVCINPYIDINVECVKDECVYCVP